mmetsp:Transcript_4126/g.11854  ORF Transcript_4126/g.11854 Transcript_4126/m.11854 type:complete len:235 (-) Transcript_4126:1595-2299(-)
MWCRLLAATLLSSSFPSRLRRGCCCRRTMLRAAAAAASRSGCLAQRRHTQARSRGCSGSRGCGLAQARRRPPPLRVLWLRRALPAGWRRLAAARAGAQGRCAFSCRFQTRLVTVSAPFHWRSAAWTPSQHPQRRRRSSILPLPARALAAAEAAAVQWRAAGMVLRRPLHRGSSCRRPRGQPHALAADETAGAAAAAEAAAATRLQRHTAPARPRRVRLRAAGRGAVAQAAGPPS